MASNSKNLAELLNGDVTVTATDIADGSVTAAKLASTAITTDKLNIGQVGGNRNMIINGACQVAQRGTTTTVPTDGNYLVDRFYITHFGSNNNSVIEMSQDTDVPANEGFYNSIKLDVTTADTDVGNDGWVIFGHKIEGYNTQRIKKGTPNAEELTLSFWVKSGQLHTYVIDLYDEVNTRQISRSFTISAVDTWEKIIWNIPADTTGTLPADNNQSLALYIHLSDGLFSTGSTLNTSWNASTNSERAVGCDTLTDSTSNYLNLTGFQLELGDTATPFEHKLYQDEISACMRYFQRVGRVRGSGNRDAGNNVCAYSGALPVIMRDTPTGTFVFQGSPYNWTNQDFQNEAKDHIAVLVDIDTEDAYWYYNDGYELDAEM